MKPFRLLLLLLSITGTLGLFQVRAASPPENQHFQVRGAIRQIQKEEKTLIVEHEAIPDYMPGMTMPFEVRDLRELDGLAAGDAIEFQLTVEERDSWISGLKKIDSTTLKLAPKRSQIAKWAVLPEPLKPGDALPAFRLTDQAGRELTRESYASHPLLVTFIFTRCPMPNFCPLMSQNLQEIQRKLAAEDEVLTKSIRYLSISFDLEFDTPAVLAEYAARYHADGEQWRFATGSSEEIKRLTAAFRIAVEAEEGTLSHNLATALIGADGKVKKIFRGNEWKVEDAIAAIKATAASP